MKFEFNSLDELKQFLQFINQDKDSILKEASKELNQSSDQLKNAIKNEEKK